MRFYVYRMWSIFSYHHLLLSLLLLECVLSYYAECVLSYYVECGLLLSPSSSPSSFSFRMCSLLLCRMCSLLLHRICSLLLCRMCSLLLCRMCSHAITFFFAFFFLPRTLCLNFVHRLFLLFTSIAGVD